MSARPTRVKAANRLRKAMRPGTVTYIDLVQWLMDRRYAQTKGGARKLLIDGRVKSESHVIGRAKFGSEFVPTPLVPAGLRGTIRVSES